MTKRGKNNFCVCGRNVREVCYNGFMNNTTGLVNTEFTVAFVDDRGNSHFYEVGSPAHVRFLTQGLSRNALIITLNGIQISLDEVLSL